MKKNTIIFEDGGVNKSVTTGYSPCNMEVILFDEKTFKVYQEYTVINEDGTHQYMYKATRVEVF